MAITFQSPTIEAHRPPERSRQTGEAPVGAEFLRLTSDVGVRGREWLVVVKWTTDWTEISWRSLGIALEPLIGQ
jgi:hypothetical protein